MHSWHDVNKYKSQFKLNLKKLAVSFGMVAEFHWTVAIAKLQLEPTDYASQKKLFHAIRLLDYGIQIAENGILLYIYDHP